MRDHAAETSVAINRGTTMKVMGEQYSSRAYRDSSKPAAWPAATRTRDAPDVPSDSIAAASMTPYSEFGLKDKGDATLICHS